MTRKKCENKQENEKNCPCEDIDCSRHGICCECVSHHRADGEKPACLE